VFLAGAGLDRGPGPGSATPHNVPRSRNVRGNDPDEGNLERLIRHTIRYRNDMKDSALSPPRPLRHYRTGTGTVAKRCRTGKSVRPNARPSSARDPHRVGRNPLGWTLCLTLSDRSASWARRRPRGYVYCAGRCELRLYVLGTVRIRPLLACGGCTGRIVRPFHARGTGMPAGMRCRNALIHSPAWPGRV